MDGNNKARNTQRKLQGYSVNMASSEHEKSLVDLFSGMMSPR